MATDLGFEGLLPFTHAQRQSCATVGDHGLEPCLGCSGINRNHDTTGRRDAEKGYDDCGRFVAKAHDRTASVQARLMQTQPSSNSHIGKITIRQLHRRTCISVVVQERACRRLCSDECVEVVQARGRHPCCAVNVPVDENTVLESPIASTVYDEGPIASTSPECSKAQSLLQGAQSRVAELAIRGNQSGQQRPAEAIRLRPSSRESTHLGGRLGARVAIRTTHDSLGEGGEGGTGGEGEAEKGKRRQRSASEARASPSKQAC